MSRAAATYNEASGADKTPQVRENLLAAGRYAAEPRDASCKDLRLSATRIHDCLIVGAGLSGLAAARALYAAGKDILLFDKARGVGGRMATRRSRDCVFDHGAQFFTVRDTRFQAAVAEWLQCGAAVQWTSGGFAGQTLAKSDGFPRYRGAPGMTEPAKQLARGLPLQLNAAILSAAPTERGWRVVSAQGAEFHGRSLLLTAPAPQSLALLAAGGFALSAPDQEALAAIEYAPCIAVLARLAAPSRLPAPGALQLERAAPDAPEGEGALAWICDNQQKGVSPAPCVTLHATRRHSRLHLETPETAAAQMLREASAWLGADVIEFTTHRWRYSVAESLHPARCLVADRDPPLVFAGDGFGAPRVEGAYLSGLAAAGALLNRI